MVKRTSKPKSSRSKSRPRKKTSGGVTDLLLEIGTEELPSHFIPPTLQNLEQSAEHLLKEYRLTSGGLRAYGTPRRLVLVVDLLAEQQAGSVKEAMGPPRSVAFDPSGQPTKAATGFAAAQGVAVDALEIRQTPKGEYVCAVKREQCLSARVVLQQLLPELVRGLPFSKTMRWNESGLRFARPIRWLVAICGGDVVKVEVGGIKAGDRTRGHRFLGGERPARERGLVVKHLPSYLSVLERSSVIVDQNRRREMIVSQLGRLADSVQGRLDPDDQLLEQAIFSVEYPHAILGGFDAAYLSLPDEILKTAMKEHQGYFPLVGRDGSLLPRFIAVTNMHVRNMTLIREGNERVLAARLADAKFFFDEDRKLRLVDRVEQLKNVTFHHKLGTMHQETGRVMALAVKIADLLGVESPTKTSQKCNTGRHDYSAARPVLRHGNFQQ